MKNKGSSTFDELKRQLTNLEKDIQIKQYDYSSNETNKAISKTLDAEFHSPNAFVPYIWKREEISESK